MLYRIPLYKPTPVYTVKVSDLRSDLEAELDDLDDGTLNEVMTDSIGHLFENENRDYFLLSVKRLLQWRFVE